MVKERNIILVYIFTLITGCIYGIYWMVSTKNEMNNEFGAEIPTAWWLIVPIGNIWWLYKYAEGFAMKVKKDNNVALWVILFILVTIVAPGFVQSELNSKAAGGSVKPTVAKPKVAAKPITK